jgi:hypothetical protein
LGDLDRRHADPGADLRGRVGENPRVSVHEPLERDVDEDTEPSRRPVVAGVAAGLWALLVGVALVTCVVMAVWAVSPNSAGDSAAAWRAAGSVWLGAHQVPLEIGDRELTLLPLGALFLGLLLTRRGGRWAGRLLAEATPREAATIVVSCAIVYAAGGAGVAWLATGPGTGASPPVAFLWTGAVALVGATWGIARSAELAGLARTRVSDGAWRTAMGAVAAVAGLLCAGAVLVTVSLVRHFGELATTLAELEAGPAGALALTVLGMLCLPTLDIWAMALVVGPGVDLGSSGSLSVVGGQVESLPALPFLAAIPTTPPGWAPALLAIPVILGGLAGRIRWGRDLPTLSGSAVSGAGLAGVVAALVGGLVLLASGSLGGGRLAEVGPDALPVAGAAAGLVLLGFLADAGLQSLRLTWELHQAERRAEESRLRRAARGVAEPSNQSDPDPEPEDTTPVVDGVEAGADEVVGTGSEESPAIPPTGAPRVRKLPRVREALVIPIVVAGVDPQVSPGPVGADAEQQAVADDPGESADGPLETGAGVAAEEPEPDIPVEQTGRQENSEESDDGVGDVPVDEAPEEHGLREPGGDATVDLTVDPADMADLRAARAQAVAADS